MINFADLVAGAGRALVIMVSGDHQWLDGLLPHLAGVVVQQIERTGSDVLVWAHARAEDGICPSCGGRFRRVHNRYHRGLADSPVAGQPVVLRLQVRRFFCDNHDCPVRTFAEPFDGLTVKHAPDVVVPQGFGAHRVGAGRQGRLAPGGPTGIRGRSEHAAASGARTGLLSWLDDANPARLPVAAIAAIAALSILGLASTALSARLYARRDL